MGFVPFLVPAVVYRGKGMNYESRCLKKLKELAAPLENWRCVGMIDGDEADFQCELCGYESVRYVHLMKHDEYPEKLRVGCICAGVMEGDLLAAKDRDRKMKNRAKRKQNFPKRNWNRLRNGSFHLRYRGKHLFLNEVNGRYNCCCAGIRVYRYRNRPITDFLSAAYAAFDLADPVEEVMQ